MAGNTKFLGFGSDNQITLERWGEKASVALPGPAIEVLRQTCFERLPKRPKEQQPHGRISYNESSGTIEMELVPEEAKVLRAFLQGTEDRRTGDADPRILSWAEDLKFALKSHEHYHDTRDEPGVESEP